MPQLPAQGIFFKGLLGCGILLWVVRSWLQPRHAEPTQQLPNRPLVEVHRPANRNLRTQIGTAPADDFVPLQVRALQQQRSYGLRSTPLGVPGLAFFGGEEFWGAD